MCYLEQVFKKFNEFVLRRAMFKKPVSNHLLSIIFYNYELKTVLVKVQIESKFKYSDELII